MFMSVQSEVSDKFDFFGIELSVSIENTTRVFGLTVMFCMKMSEED